jgi:hypothetical protein
MTMKAEPDFRQSPLPGDGETADQLKDLIEGLTALGNYLSAANHMASGRTSCTQQVLAETLEKAQAQYVRSASALARLRAVSGGRQRSPAAGSLLGGETILEKPFRPGQCRDR